MTVAIAGAGWSGAVIARRLAENGYRVDVFDSRAHVGGNCYTESRDGVTVHVYGPHIFHTDNDAVWRYVNRWAHWDPYRLAVRSTSRGEVFQLPVNLHTINQIHGQAWTPSEAAHALDCRPGAPESFDDAAEAAVGPAIYQRLFRGYTAKQWGVDPSRLPASVFRRLPVRFDYDDNYFHHGHQALPVGGYTPIFERLLDHSNITVKLNRPFDASYASAFEWVFWSGPLDAWFGHCRGRLGYRTLRFDWSTHPGPYQGVALMNWPDPEVPWTRVTEHNYLTPNPTSGVAVVSTEYPADAGPDDEPYYPLRLTDDRKLLDEYVAMSAHVPNVTFVGRLGTYRYLDMDVTIAEALDTSDRWLLDERFTFATTP